MVTAMSATFLLVLAVTLLGSSTAAEVKLTGVINIPIPIIGDAYFEDIAPPYGDPAFEGVSNLTNININASRHLQASIAFQTQMLNAINKERGAYGLQRLCMNTKLQNAAQGHSNDMAAKDYMSHTGSDGSKPPQRIRKAGYRQTASGENVAAGQTMVDEVMKAWMASPPHRKNILRSQFTMFGCGYAYSESSTYKHHWTQNFGASNTERCTGN